MPKRREDSKSAAREIINKVISVSRSFWTATRPRVAFSVTEKFPQQ